MSVNLVSATLPSAAPGWTSTGGADDIRRKIALALMQKSMSSEPLQSKWQVAAQMMQGLQGGMELSRIRKEDQDASNSLMNLPGLGGAKSDLSPYQPPQPAPTSAPFGGIVKGLMGIGGGGAAPAAADVPAPAPAAPVSVTPPEPRVDIPNPSATASLDPSLGQMAFPQGERPGMSNDIVRQARYATDPIPLPRPRPDVPPAAPVMASDGMPAPRPPGDIPGPLGQQYVDAIKKSEGFVPKAGWDYKQYTNGYGTRAQGPGETIDRATAEQRLASELGKAAAIVDKIAPNAPEGVRAALTSLTFNSGDKWTRSGLGQMVQAGDWQGAAQRFQQYNKAGGQVLPGLAQRRALEAQWFGNGLASQAPTTAMALAQNQIPLPRPRPDNIPQDPQPAPQPTDPGLMSNNAPVRVASLGGVPQTEPPYPAQKPPAPNNVQLAQAGGQPPEGVARQQGMIPPEVATQIRALLANPRTRQYGMQLYQQYAKPQTPEWQKLNDETLFEKGTAQTKQVTSGYRPLTDPAERQQYGIPPHDTRPYQVGPANKLVNPPPENRINIDQRAESAFDVKAAESQVKRFNDLVETGFGAKAMRADVNTLRDLGSRFGTGKEAEIKAALGPYAESLGIKVDNLGEMQAYNAIVAKLAPRMRPAGSGATSDYEMRKYLEALPGLGKTPEGNALIEQTMEALQNHQESAMEIASRALNKEISPREADKLLRGMPDPMTAWKEWKKKQPTDGSTPVRKFNPATGLIE